MVCRESARGTNSYTLGVEPVGILLEVTEGETVMSAAQRRGYRWPTLCNGDGTCTICWTEVIEGSENLSPMLDGERQVLGALSVYLHSVGSVRLACQARVQGHVTVRKVGVRAVSTEIGIQDRNGEAQAGLCGGRMDRGPQEQGAARPETPQRDKVQEKGFR